MALRFCPRCASEVEDVGGFCLLGHALRLEPPIPSVARIRDEVTRAFDEARSGPVEVLQHADTPSPAEWSEPSPTSPGDPMDPPPKPAEQASVWEVLSRGAETDIADPIAAFAPPPRMDWGPERPGLLETARARKERSATG
jgi:hypothetical protein